MEKEIEGIVSVSFVINTRGEVADVNIVKGADPLLDIEALRVISSMPKWTPGSQNGKLVSVALIRPIKFAFK